MRTYTTYDERIIKFRSNERLGWLAPARQQNVLLVEMFNIVGERERPNLGFVRDVRAA